MSTNRNAAGGIAPGRELEPEDDDAESGTLKYDSPEFWDDYFRECGDLAQSCGGWYGGDDAV